MANEGHIVIKKSGGRFGMSQFFKEVDKGAAKPAFCYPKKAEFLKEELTRMKKAYDDGYVAPNRKLLYKQKMNELEKRVEQIDASFAGAKEIIEKDKDAWSKRRENLAQQITEMTPTRDDVKKRTVNPHTVLRREKQGTNGSPPLEQLKREYTIISRAFQAAGDYEESNHSFLQKDR